VSPVPDDNPSVPHLVRQQSATVVELRGIRKSYGDKEVLHGVDLSVHAGEHVVIFGPSGSGKSTLLRTINLLEEPSEGSVRVLGVEYGPGIGGEKLKRGKSMQLRRHVGMVFQQFNLFPHLTALDNIARPLRSAKGLSRTDAEAAAARGLHQVGLLDWAAHYPAQLSGGQAQRVAIARALAGRPPIILADEPTAALDAHTGQGVMETLTQLAHDGGHTVVVVTHDNRIFKFGDRIVRIEDGRITEDTAHANA
jgi:ABC-type polar amino acid transport system ATPase subunit